MYGDRPGRPEDLYRFEDVSFAQIARDMGCFGVRVESPEDIAPALREALASNLPAVVEVMTHMSARAPDPWSPKRLDSTDRKSRSFRLLRNHQDDHEPF